jgi:hypothetical protein
MSKSKKRCAETLEFSFMATAVPLDTADLKYLQKTPTSLPMGWVLAHNRVMPVHPLGLNGFRAWIQKPDSRLIKCDCGWARQLGEHYMYPLRRAEGQPL